MQESRGAIFSIELVNKDVAQNSPSLNRCRSLMIGKARRDISFANLKFSEWIDGEPIFLDRKPSKIEHTEKIRKKYKIQKLKEHFNSLVEYTMLTTPQE